MIRQPVLFRAFSALVVSLLFAVALPGVALAEAGFQFGVPNRNFPDDEDVNGMRASLLWGKNRKTSGFDLGLFSVSQTEVRSGLAIVGGISRVTGKSDGAVALSFMNYHTGEDSGANLAFVNMVNDTRNAFNMGFVQIAQGETAADLGALNISKKSKFQIGFVNITEQIDGLQIGFINMAENGFFPFFPLFNYAKQPD